MIPAVVAAVTGLGAGWIAWQLGAPPPGFEGLGAGIALGLWAGVLLRGRVSL